MKAAFPAFLVLLVILAFDCFQVRGQTTWPTSQPTNRVARISGQIVKVEGTSLVLSRGPSSRGGLATEYQITTDENTKVYLDADLASLDELKPGMRIVCSERLSPQAHVPILEISAMSSGINATIISVDGLKISLSEKAVGQKSSDAILTCDAETKVYLPPNVDHPGMSLAKTSELRSGMQVKIILKSSGHIGKIFVYPSFESSNPTTQPHP